MCRTNLRQVLLHLAEAEPENTLPRSVRMQHLSNFTHVKSRQQNCGLLTQHKAPNPEDRLETCV